MGQGEEGGRLRLLGVGENVAAGARRRCGSPGAQVIRTVEECAARAAGQSAADLAEPCTYVVDGQGRLGLALPRGEHCACAGAPPSGPPVRSPGRGPGRHLDGGGGERPHHR
ncbi:hypothetical protein ACGF1Z_33305 [Streptomyces sp. NPDC048018]|uniref:hypothetical protein n=1 Tax=Streptomyces sp. NPDC048018 TaxID=3365499 RepID=UPI0037125EC5